jgi:L-ascorbate metabolism protein UlaG (beta-lactamase superfamily)
MSEIRTTVQFWKLDKAILLFPLVLLLSSPPSFAQTESSSVLLEQIRAHDSGIAIWWTGQNGWLVKLDDLLISTDLVLEERERIFPPPISSADLAPELDIFFVTHEHGDHFHPPTSRVLARESECIFVVPRNCVEKARKLGVPEHRIRIASPRQPFQLRGIEVKPLRALHGNPNYAVHAKANLEDCGYLINFQGKSILQPGDSVLLEDHLFLEHVDVLFFSPTVHNTHIDRSVLLINALEPDYILPQHRRTYRETPQNQYWTHAYVEEVKWLLSDSLQQRYYVLEPGERLLIE